ncbi:MAG: right-handed parallel beta-helix repeat-containing protein [Candidatus Entotheonellia bacterium]
MTIDGVQGVSLMGFTIRNSPGQGILGVGGAASMVKDTTMQNNGGGGIFLNNNSLVELTDVEVKESEGIGIAVFNNSTAVFKGHVSSTGSSSTVSGSSGGGSALIVGGLTVQNNQTGLLADGAGALTLVSVPPSNPSRIEHKSGTDVDLSFGTRVTFGGVIIGTITCDATVLSRPSTVCP